MAKYASVEEELNAMIAGTHEDNINEDEEIGTESEDAVEVNDNDEDTSQEDEVELEDGTDQEDDGQTDGTDEDDTEDEVDNTLAEQDGSEEDAEEYTTEDETVEDTKANDKDEADTDEKGDGQVPENTDVVDYQEKYKQLLEESREAMEFRDKVVNTKFIANKKEVTGFTNPDDIIRAQQALHGYDSKMKVIKEHTKYLKSLKDNGMIEDPDKFNLAMSLVNGDPEAIKKVIKDNSIDPLMLDMDNIAYKVKDYRATDEEITIENTFDTAKTLGVDERLADVLSSEWDTASKREFMSNSAVRSDLVKHLSDGTYDTVMDRVAKMRMTDIGGVFKEMSSVDQYRQAAGIVYQENMQSMEKAKQLEESKAKEVKQKTATQKQIDTQAEEAYKAKAAKKAAEAAEAEKRVTEQRKKAVSVSKKKPKAQPKTKPKLEELTGDEFRKAFDKEFLGL